MRFRRFAIPLVLGVVLLVDCRSLYATNWSGSVNASYDSSSNTLVVNATVGSQQCGDVPGATIYVDGYGFSRSFTCPTLSSCTVYTTYTDAQLGCLTPGSHQVTAWYFCGST